MCSTFNKVTVVASFLSNYLENHTTCAKPVVGRICCKSFSFCYNFVRNIFRFGEYLARFPRDSRRNVFRFLLKISLKIVEYKRKLNEVYKFKLNYVLAIKFNENTSTGCRVLLGVYNGKRTENAILVCAAQG
jgi:hypothetical protein